MTLNTATPEHDHIQWPQLMLEKKRVCGGTVFYVQLWELYMVRIGVLYSSEIGELCEDLVRLLPEMEKRENRTDRVYLHDLESG